MIVWRGRGILVAIITFVCLLITELLTRFFFRNNTYYQQHRWPITLIMALRWALDCCGPIASVADTTLSDGDVKERFFRRDNLTST